MEIIEDAVYRAVKHVWPDPFPVIIAYQGAPEPKPPYGVITVMPVDLLNKQHINSLAYHTGDVVITYPTSGYGWNYGGVYGGDRWKGGYGFDYGTSYGGEMDGGGYGQSYGFYYGKFAQKQPNVAIEDKDEMYSLRMRHEYSVVVRFETYGPDAGSNIQKLSRSFGNPYYDEKFLLEGLGYSSQSVIRKAPRLQETDWLDHYQLDVTFFFAHEEDQAINVVEKVNVTTADGTTIYIR